MSEVYEESLGVLQSHFEALKRSFDKGLTLDVEWRKFQLKALHKGIQDCESEIIKAEKADLGKAVPLIVVEIGTCLKEIEEAYSNVDEWVKDVPISTPIELQPGKSWRQPKPKGLALIISAWNFPLALALQPLVGAIAAGCCVVVKPNEGSPETAKVVCKIIDNYLDQAAFRSVQGGVKTSSALVSEFHFDKIFFTGGSKVGRKIAEAGVKYFADITLELGGKNPLIIDEYVDVKTAVWRTVYARMENAGQFCLSPDYCLVHTNVAKEFLTELERFYTECWGCNPGTPEAINKMPARIVNEYHWERLNALIKEAEDSSCEILIGGSKLANKSLRYIPFTVVLNPPLEMEMMREEIFGPILPVFIVNTLDESIEFVKKMPCKHPLNLYVFSSKKDNVSKVLQNTMSGNACVNECAVNVISSTLPFGGVGESGHGSYHGKWSFECFTHYRSVMQRSTIIDPFLGTRNFKIDLDHEFLTKLYRFLFYGTIKEDGIPLSWMKGLIMIVAVLTSFEWLLRITKC